MATDLVEELGGDTFVFDADRVVRADFVAQKRPFHREILGVRLRSSRATAHGPGRSHGSGPRELMMSSCQQPQDLPMVLDATSQLPVP